MLRSSTPALSPACMFAPTRLLRSIPPIGWHETAPSVQEVRTLWTRAKEAALRYNPFVNRDRFDAILNRKYMAETMTEDGQMTKAANIILLAPLEFTSKPFAAMDGTNAPRMKMLFVKRRQQQVDAEGLDVTPTSPSAMSAASSSLYVFPGGKVDVADVRELEENELVQRQIVMHRGGAMPWAARRITVLRELYEQVGVIMDGHGKLRPKKYQHFNIHHMSGLVPFAHWTTPVQEAPRRFDTAYFLCAVQPEAVTDVELVLNNRSGKTEAGDEEPDSDDRIFVGGTQIEDAQWLTPEATIAMHNDPRSGFKIPPPLQLIVHQLAQFPSVKSACAHYECRNRNDLLEMKRIDPFVDVTNGKFNMHLRREVVPDIPTGQHVFSLGYAIPPVYVEHHKKEMARLRAAKRAEREARGEVVADAEEDENGAAAASSPEEAVKDEDVQLVIHVGSPLMEPSNALLEREYAKVVEHRKNNRPGMRDKLACPQRF